MVSLSHFGIRVMLAWENGFRNVFFSLMSVHTVLSKRPQTICIFFFNPFFIFLFSLCDFHYLDKITYLFLWASLVSQLVENPPAMWETWIRSLGWEDSLEKGKATQYSGLENSMDCIIHGVAKS